MDTYTQETHEALLSKAVSDATDKLSGEVASLQETVASLTEERDRLADENADLKETNGKLNGDLDASQVELKATKDRVVELEGEIAKRDEEAAKAEVARKRAEEVRALGLFTDEYITEKAARWADVSDEEWADRVDEWKTAKAQSSNTDGGVPTDSAMKGSSEGQGSTQSARRAILGLVN